MNQIKFGTIYLTEDNYMKISVTNEECVECLNKIGDEGQKILDDLIEHVTKEFNKIYVLGNKDGENKND